MAYKVSKLLPSLSQQFKPQPSYMAFGFGVKGTIRASTPCHALFKRVTCWKTKLQNPNLSFNVRLHADRRQNALGGPVSRHFDERRNHVLLVA